MKSIVAFLLLSGNALAADKEYIDYNFDGVADYRIYRESDGKMHFYDIFLYSPSTKKYQKSDILSGLFNPSPDSKLKEIHCIAPGGHSGGIFYREDYAWKDDALTFLRTVQQTDKQVDGNLVYVRVTSVIRNGKPFVDDIQILNPQELRK